MPRPISTVLITGAGSGLGLELVRHWLYRGASVIATARGPLKGGPLARLQAAAAGRLGLVPLDVASDNSLRALGQRLRRGGVTIDLLVNHASVRQIVGLDRLSLKAPGPPFSFQALATLRVGYAVLDQLTPGAPVVCLATPPAQASEFGSLSQPPRISPAALATSLAGLAAELGRRGSPIALLYPGAAGKAGKGDGERIAWIAEVTDLLIGPRIGQQIAPPAAGAPAPGATPAPAAAGVPAAADLPAGLPGTDGDQAGPLVFRRARTKRA